MSRISSAPQIAIFTGIFVRFVGAFSLRSKPNRQLPSSQFHALPQELMFEMLNFRADRVVTDFEKKWSPNSRCLQEHLKQVGAEEQQGLLKRLIEVDVELCISKGIHVDAKEYSKYGEAAVAAAEKVLESTGSNDKPRIADATSTLRVAESEISFFDFRDHTRDSAFVDQDEREAFAAGFDKNTYNQNQSDTPEFIGGYRILNRLAVHGQGAVYRADHPHLNRQVVIKVSKNQLDENNQQAVVDEGRALATLSHPNLAQVYDLQFQDGCPFLVMEYIEGRNLAECLKDKKLPLSESAEMIAILAEAIHHAHEVGVVHRDLKPANVVIRATDQTPKIIDFGLATTRTAYADDLLNTTFGGTIAYMAPEQAQQLISRYTGEAEPTVDERIDVFALGAILYQLTTGRRLYPFENQMEGLRLAAECKFDGSPLDEIPSELSKICRKALAKDPAERWRSASEFADALRASIATKSSIPRLPIAVLVMFGGLLLCLATWFAIDRISPPGADGGNNLTTSAAPNRDSDNPAKYSMQTASARLLPGATFTHFMNKSETRSSGRLFENGPVREDDDLRIEVQFEEPVYCFLFALNPDGAVQLCYPYPDSETYEESLDEVQAVAISDLKYPAIENEGFAFTDGAGQQAFILVSSKKPLPTFRDWSKSASNLTEVLQATGHWVFADGTLSPLVKLDETRGAPRKLRGSEPFGKVMNAIQATNQECEVSGLSFPVEANFPVEPK